MRFDRTQYESGTSFKGWTIIHSHKILDRETKLVNPKDFLGIYFSFINELEYNIKDLQQGTMKGLHYCLVNLPKRSCELTLPAGLYESVLIKFDRIYFEHMAEYFPMLKQFLLKVEANVPASISGKPLLATPGMIADIYKMMNNEFRLPKKLRGMHMDSKIPEILLMCIHYSQSQDRLSERDVVKLKKVYEYVTAHIDYGFTIRKIADIVFMDHVRLRKGFKILYGESFRTFLYNIRMKKAALLLKDKTLPVSKVAAQVGYKKLKSFTLAFTRKYGSHPDTFRK